MAQYYNMASAGLQAIGSGFYKLEPKQLSVKASNRQVIQEQGGLDPQMLMNLVQNASAAYTRESAQQKSADEAFAAKREIENDMGMQDTLDSGGTLSLEQSQRMADQQTDSGRMNLINDVIDLGGYEEDDQYSLMSGLSNIGTSMGSWFK